MAQSAKNRTITRESSANPSRSCQSETGGGIGGQGPRSARLNLDKARIGLSARNGLRAWAEGSHGSAMAPTSDAAFEPKDAEMVKGNFGTPH